MQEKFFHMRANVFTRSNNDRIVAKAAYRSGEILYDEKYDRTHNFSGKLKKDEIESEIYLPGHVNEKFKNRSFLYNEIERKEKSFEDRQLARELEFSLYTEFTPEENKKMVEEFAKKFTEDGMIVDCCFHKLNGKNPHCHMLLTLRDVKEDGLSFGNKNRSWNHPNMNKKWRKEWETIVNRKFKEKGLDIFISRKSFQERGIDKKPTKHLPWDRESPRYQEVLTENKKIKKQNEFKQKKKEIKQEVEQIKEVKQIVRNAKVAELQNRKEVLTMGQEQKQPVHQYEEPGENTQSYEEPEQTKTVGDLFKEEIQGLQDKFNRLTENSKLLKENKKRSYERYREHKENDFSKKMSLKKDDLANMKLNYGMRKTDLKRTKIFSLSGFQERRTIKADLKKMKLQMKKKKLEMKKEKKKLKLYKKEYIKDRKKLVTNFKDRAKTLLQMKRTERTMNKTQNLNQKLDKNKVVSLQGFKKQKMKLEMKPKQNKQLGKKLEL
ncbi:MobA/MobL family protein [Bacillus paranthracis]|uniref:MobA/MobL family protein n=1 Tax=Bacillus paranthracis TaxID=2026186 RepID=UPI0021D12B90|nr:MobA/MobL family protein [Bacillus paranthracis]MCU4954491.1 MobA/MobL family protein [Bacillus paranthracis]